MVSEEVSLAVTILSKTHSRAVLGGNASNHRQTGYLTAFREAVRPLPSLRPTIFPVQNSDRQNLFWTRVKPKAYAQRLVLRYFGLTSEETLKKDRKKLRAAANKHPLG